MKNYLISVICLLLAFCFSLTAAAAQSVTLAEDNMTLQIPEDFTIISKDNVPQMASALQPYGTTVTETSVKLDRENYLFLGISSTMRCTLFLTKQEDSVSRTIGDLISYEDPDTARSLLLGKTLPENTTVRELEQNGALFYRVDFGVTEKVGRIAYITVMNDAAYTLCVVDNSGSLSDNTNALIDTVFKNWEYTIKAEEERIQAFRQQVTSTVYWICLPLALIAGFFLIRLIIRDIRRNHVDSDRKKNIPKKPRR